MINVAEMAVLPMVDVASLLLYRLSWRMFELEETSVAVIPFRSSASLSKGEDGTR